MDTAMPLPRVPVVRAGATRPSELTTQVRGVDGTSLATLDVAPPLLAHLTVRQLRAEPKVRHAPDPEVILRAGELFATARLGGLSPSQYCELQARASGTPVEVSRRTLSEMRATCAVMSRRVTAERPSGAGSHVTPGQISAVWVRRGDVLSVIAPGNNPGVHVQWVQAVALGYRLVIRPGARDPFTPARLVSALLEAGVEPSHLSLLPGGYDTADALVRAADLSLVFGGDEVVQRYADSPTVIPRGPGRSKVLHSGPITDSTIDVTATSVGYDGGLRCTNATAVFTEGDPRELGEALAAALAPLTAAPPQSPSAQLPVLPTGKARALRDYLESRLDGAVDVAAARYDDGGVAELGDGSAALRAAVLVCDRPDHPGASVELPFPCVWVLPWQRSLGVRPLGDTLSLTVLGDAPDLAAEALHEPRVRKVLVGPLPTFSAGDTSPHDGYLSRDLMEARGYGIAAHTAAEPPAARQDVGA